jgi:hypothetical protein
VVSRFRIYHHVSPVDPHLWHPPLDHPMIISLRSKRFAFPVTTIPIHGDTMTDVSKISLVGSPLADTTRRYPFHWH